MTEIQKQILSARPSLRKILPVVFWCTAVYAVLNLALAFGILLWHPSTYPLVAPSDNALLLWGGLYGSVGVLLAWGLQFKRWEQLRGFMCLALFFKILWSIALLFRIDDGGTFLIFALFMGLAALQAVIIIFYLPPDEAVDGRAP